MPDIKPPESIIEFPLAFIKQSIALATAGFGIVVALAWNELVRDIIANYIEPYLGTASGTISKLVYALIMTFLAIAVTMQLTHIQGTLERILPKGKKKEETEVPVEKVAKKQTKAKKKK